jgi:hypothetical protein
MNWFLEKVDEDIFIKSGEDSVEEINNIQAGGYGKVEVWIEVFFMNLDLYISILMKLTYIPVIVFEAQVESTRNKQFLMFYGLYIFYLHRSTISV